MYRQKRGEPDYEAFDKDFSDAVGYHRCAERFLAQGERVSLVFNVASCALERYLVAICDAFGVMPLNHNYNCLMDEVEQLLPVPPRLCADIRALDGIFGICSLDDYHHGVPEEPDMRQVLALCSEVEAMFDNSAFTAARAACTSAENPVPDSHV
ncbi:hypothetical protein [Ethanoligenens sp.]|uniref:hypothetical protein n=1 Tax=Ethanoligenens sp. TaxID=2099655 RepID=UPI0039EB5905